MYGRVRRRGRKEESRKLSFVENFPINQQHCWHLHGGGAGCPAQDQSPVVQGSVVESLQLKYETGNDVKENRQMGGAGAGEEINSWNSLSLTCAFVWRVSKSETHARIPFLGLQ